MKIAKSDFISSKHHALRKRDLQLQNARADVLSFGQKPLRSA